MSSVTSIPIISVSSTSPQQGNGIPRSSSMPASVVVTALTRKKNTVPRLSSHVTSSFSSLTSQTDEEKKFVSELPQPMCSADTRRSSRSSLGSTVIEVGDTNVIVEEPSGSRQISFGTTCSSFETCLASAANYRHTIGHGTHSIVTVPTTNGLRSSVTVSPATDTDTDTMGVGVSTGKPTAMSNNIRKRSMSQLMLNIEHQNWKIVKELAEANPEEVKVWTTIRTKPTNTHHKNDNDNNKNKNNKNNSSNEKKTVTKVKRLPLHHACLKLRTSSRTKNNAPSLNNNNNSKEDAALAIIALISLYPEATSLRESRHGCLPLHLFAFSCRLDNNNDKDSAALVSVLDALLIACPKAPCVESEGGRLPLHMACSSRACLPILRRLIEVYPSAARHRTTEDSSLPLHLLAEAGLGHPDAPRYLLRAYPDAAAGLNRFQRTPCMEALKVAGECGRDYQQELIQALRRCPGFWISENSSSNLSSQSDTNNHHTANLSSIELALTLPSNHHHHTTTTNTATSTDRKLPQSPTLLNDSQEDNTSSPSLSSEELHTLALKTELVDLIQHRKWPAIALRSQLLGDEASEWSTVTSRSGRTMRCLPLHNVCERDPPLPVVLDVLRSHPRAVTTPNVPARQLPLHVACTWGASPDVVRVVCGDATARARDENGNLPLHAACYSGADAAVIRILLRVYPRGVWMTNTAGVTALDVVRRLTQRDRHNRKEVAELLLQQMRHTTNRQDKSGESNPNMIQLSLSSTSDEDEDNIDGAGSKMGIVQPTATNTEELPMIWV